MVDSETHKTIKSIKVKYQKSKRINFNKIFPYNSTLVVQDSYMVSVYDANNKFKKLAKLRIGIHSIKPLDNEEKYLICDNNNIFGSEHSILILKTINLEMISKLVIDQMVFDIS